jgi:S1-C subfamily serine protease
MLPLLALLVTAGQFETIPSDDFPKDLQVRALTATVRIENPAQEVTGSGVVVGSEGRFLYVLTAAHVVAKAERLEVHVFAAGSYPTPEHIYDQARVVASAEGLSDLALIRVPTRDGAPASLRVCPPRLLPAEKELPVLTVGCSAGEAPTCLEERAARKRVRRQAGGEIATVWEASRRPDTGRSGGALLGKRGYLLGICSGASGDRGYYIDPETIQAFLKANGFKWLYEEDP